MNDPNVQKVIIADSRSSSSIGIASFIIGLLSIFFLSIIFVPISLILGVIGVIKGQLLWSILGIIMAIIGFLTSPMLLGLLGIVSLSTLL